jgi:D-aminopeptidase
VINGFGKATGLAQVVELGNIETPVLLTNTLSVGRVWDAVVSAMISDNPDIGIGPVGTVNPVVGECNDGYLNDIQGRHVAAEHVQSALDGAGSGPVAEGAVGAGTGMSCFGYKGGIGTASRVIAAELGGFKVGILVLANFGRSEDLLISGVPVGRELKQWSPPPPGGPDAAAPGPTGAGWDQSELDTGSVMVILATDAPLDSRQLGRLSRRAGLGLARTGSIAGHGSGDFVIAFAHTGLQSPDIAAPTYLETRMAEDGRLMGALFQATIEATEESVVNALFAAPTVVGRDDHVRHGLPVDLVLDILRRQRRIS